MNDLISELNRKFRNNLKNSLHTENIMNLQIKVLLGSVIHTMYYRKDITLQEWFEATEIINNLND